MNTLQEKQLEILLEVDRVCKKHNITYMLSSGTLLGAIRHKGFIPWDDDLDIMMTLDNYKRFLKIAKKELDQKYFLQSIDTDLWYHAFSKIRMNNTTMMESSYKGINFHQGIWIDIFPIVGLKDNSEWCERENKLITLSNLFLQDAFFDVTDNLSLKLRIIKSIPRSIRCSFVKLIRNFIFKSPTKFEFSDAYWGFKLRPRYRSEWFKDVVYTDFEGYSMPIPSMYEEYLTTTYGDYMTPPPPEKRNGGHTVEILDFEKSYEEYL